MINLTQTGITISIIDLAAGLLIATLLGLVVVGIYRWTHRGMHYERSFLVTLVMMPPIVGVVMLIIGSNLALSLGMVGALSIIRFRTVIKDSRDMVFLFLAIAIGLGCGARNWHVAAIATVFLCALLLILHAGGFGRAVHADFVLVVAGQGAVVPDRELQGEIAERVDFAEVRSMNVQGENWEMVFEVRFLKSVPSSPSELIAQLQQKYGADRVSLLAPQLSLPL